MQDTDLRETKTSKKSPKKVSIYCLKEFQYPVQDEETQVRLYDLKS